MLNSDELKLILDYDPSTGIFRWRTQRGSRGVAGAVAGTVKPHENNRVVIAIDKKLHKAHRLAWLYMTGEWPDGEIDHINRDASDNRFDNLRVVTHAENMKNFHKRTNKYGCPGVYLCSNSVKRGKRNVFRAVIKHDGKKINLGRFPTPEAASAAYVKAKLQMHGVQISLSQEPQ